MTHGCYAQYRVHCSIFTLIWLICMANVGSIVWLSKSQKDISRVFGIDFEAANGVSEAKFGYGNHLTRGIMILHRWWFQRFFRGNDPI